MSELKDEELSTLKIPVVDVKSAFKTGISIMRSAVYYQTMGDGAGAKQLIKDAISRDEERGVDKKNLKNDKIILLTESWLNKQNNVNPYHLAKKVASGSYKNSVKLLLKDAYQMAKSSKKQPFNEILSQERYKAVLELEAVVMSTEGGMHPNLAYSNNGQNKINANILLEKELLVRRNQELEIALVKEVAIKRNLENYLRKQIGLPDAHVKEIGKSGDIQKELPQQNKNNSLKAKIG